MTKRNIHNKIVNDLERRLGDKSYVDSVIANYGYPKGECDVLAQQGNRLIYYEVKCNHTEYSIKKAKVQLLRWSKG